MLENRSLFHDRHPWTGLPECLKNVDFCECIHKECGGDHRISYFIAPLSPFLDPGSPAFENPTQYGYKKFCHTLEDFRQAVLQPSWKNMLSYETTSMTRKEIVKATYESAKKLNQFKYDHHIIDKDVYEEVKHKIIKSVEFLERIDEFAFLPPEEKMKELASIKEEVEFINRHSICGQNELKWEVKKLFANLPSLAYIGLELLIKEIVKSLKCKLGKIVRHMVSISSPKVRTQQK